MSTKLRFFVIATCLVVLMLGGTACGVEQTPALPPTANTLLTAIPQPPDGHYVVTTFLVRCMKGGTRAEPIAFCDDPQLLQSMMLPSPIPKE